MTALRTVTWLGLVELSKNRLALILLVVFIPLWITLAYSVISSAPLPFRLRASGELLRVSGNDLTMVSGSLNAVTLLVGFQMFSTTHRARDFDLRMVAAGCRRSVLLIAKLVSLTVASGVVACWTTVVLLFYWRPEQPLLLLFGLFTAGLVYGGIGTVLGVFLPGELEGMFTIIMISIIDLALQSPLMNPAGDHELVAFLPSYSSMQTSVAAGFTHTIPLLQMTQWLAWFTGCAAVALAVFHLRTRVSVRTT